MKGWKLFPHLIVRTTGFAFERLEQLLCPEAVSGARREVAARRALEAFKAQAPRLHRPPAAVLAALKAGRPVEGEGLGDAFDAYNAHARAAQEATAGFEAALGTELARVEAALARLRTEPRFLEAVASSSPPVARDVMAGREGARLRRQLASYLQRLSAKNETMSFFGPINYGQVEPQAPTGVSVRWSGPERLLGRHTFAASWLVLGVGRAIAADPEVARWLVPRRKAYAALPPRKGPAPAAASLEDVLPRLVEAADGARPLAALKEALEVEWPVLLEALAFALRRNLLTHPLEVPAASHHPLEDLAERLAGFPGPAARRHLEGLEELLGLMARYGAADAAGKMGLNERMATRVRERWGVEPAVAAQGDNHNFYQDRLPLREECGGDLRVSVGGERARELEQRLEPALGLMAEAALRTREASRAAVAALVGARTVPFWKVVAAYGERPVPYDTSVASALAAAIPDASAACVTLEPSALPVPRGDAELPSSPPSTCSWAPRTRRRGAAATTAGGGGRARHGAGLGLGAAIPRAAAATWRPSWCGSLGEMRRPMAARHGAGLAANRPLARGAPRPRGGARRRECTGPRPGGCPSMT